MAPVTLDGYAFGIKQDMSCKLAAEWNTSSYNPRPVPLEALLASFQGLSLAYLVLESVVWLSCVPAAWRIWGWSGSEGCLLS